MKRCKFCINGEYHGYCAIASSDCSVSTVYFWCPVKQHHDQNKEACDKVICGPCKTFDKFDNQIFKHEWHRPYENSPYIDVVCASLPPKYSWTCAKCGQTTYTLTSENPPTFGCDF